ncbi:unnamed protein product [Microthlaspi erraticum]|uniref:Uncharacterized protein n=1 Tax=Microthlaspi erraticum TaxID=1685480 RepID=A0A6D2HEA0_9BRAS|nr:unnamed protein product [Microthlaspi erraticum]
MIGDDYTNTEIYSLEEVVTALPIKAGTDFVVSVPGVRFEDMGYDKVSVTVFDENEAILCVNFKPPERSTASAAVSA